MIKIDRLRKDFGRFTAVDDISFEVNQGEVLGFLGPNGAGKSTTMKMITGYLPPSSGSVTVAGYDVAEHPLEVKRRIGYLPEGAPAYPDMTPADFLDFIAEVRGFRGKEKQRRVQDTVRQVSLEDVLHQPIDTLSKGFKRRVGLAQAILHDPQVLIMDEPTDGLDPNQKHEVRTLIGNMAREKVIILSTHILEEVHAVCSRAIIIARGRIVADGTPEELEAKSQWHNSVTLTLSPGKDSPEQVREQLEAMPGVARLETLPGHDNRLRYQLYPHAARPILADVSRMVHERQWEVEEMRQNQGRLDDVFRAITA
ncbi:MAG TPA: ATP-binding cassette domain-containing protein [Sedimenticola sp.]|nr:ATP-binding cassette domain-containing protein [Sedimenticola sp.]